MTTVRLINSEDNESQIAQAFYQAFGRFINELEREQIDAVVAGFRSGELVDPICLVAVLDFIAKLRDELSRRAKRKLES